MVVDCAALVPLPMSMFAPQFLPNSSAGSGKTSAPPKYALEATHEEFPFLFPFLQNLLTVNEANGTPLCDVASYGDQVSAHERVEALPLCSLVCVSVLTHESFRSSRRSSRS